MSYSASISDFMNRMNYIYTSYISDVSYHLNSKTLYNAAVLFQPPGGQNNKLPSLKG